MASLWQADDGPLIMLLGSTLPSSTKKNLVKFGPPLTKLSGSAHVSVIWIHCSLFFFKRGYSNSLWRIEYPSSWDHHFYHRLSLWSHPVIARMDCFKSGSNSHMVASCIFVGLPIWSFLDSLQHGVIQASRPQFLPANFTTLPQKLKELGYTTHMVGKWVFCFFSYGMVHVHVWMADVIDVM